ncbi:MAG TPA: hypothetical protein ENN74_00625 [Firmicutes bacterium]|nr:hypothetical protein [Bacillota bacterium]
MLKVIVTIHQPQYLPWLGYFGKILMADAFVLLDTVQYVKNEWQNRNRLRTPQGWQWITVPVEYHFPQSLLDTRINNREPWRRKHPKTLRQLYGKAPCFAEHFDYFDALYARPWERLAELNCEVVAQLMKTFDIQVPVYRASELIVKETHPTGRLIEICRRLGASGYLSGANGRNYLEVERFHKAGLELRFQAFVHPTYEQQYPGFESHLSALDALFCCGAEQTRSLIEKGNRVEEA